MVEWKGGRGTEGGRKGMGKGEKDGGVEGVGGRKDKGKGERKMVEWNKRKGEGRRKEG